MESLRDGKPRASAPAVSRPRMSILHPAGRPGALTFGAVDTTRVETVPWAHPGSSVTLIGWGYPTASAAKPPMFSNYSADAGVYGLSVRLANRYPSCYVKDVHGLSTSWSLDFTVPLNAWCQLGLRMDTSAGTQSIVANGAAYGAYSPRVDIQQVHPIALGNYPVSTGTDTPWLGHLALLSIYWRSLDDEEIAFLYAHPPALLKGCANHWRGDIELVEGAEKLYDSQGEAHGTITDATVRTEGFDLDLAA